MPEVWAAGLEARQGESPRRQKEAPLGQARRRIVLRCRLLYLLPARRPKATQPEAGE
jgi:hypothetical protein